MKFHPANRSPHALLQERPTGGGVGILSALWVLASVPAVIRTPSGDSIMQMKKIIPVLALAGAVVAPLASAQTTTTTYYAPWQGDFWGRGYIGASAGETKFDSECDRLLVTACDKKDTGF